MKQRLINLVFHWGALNLLLLLPFSWLLTNGMPDRVDWVVRTSKPITIELFSLQDDGTQKPEASAYFFGKDESQLYKMWLPETRDESTLRWRVVGDTSDYEIRSVSVLKRLFIRKRFHLPDGGWSLDWSNRIFMGGLLGGELLLLLLSVGLSFVKVVPMKWSRSVWQSAAVAVFGAALFTVILPAQSFMVNRCYFKFETSDFLLSSMGYFLLTTLTLTVILVLSVRLWGRFLHVALTGFLMYEYLETGILAIGYPPINGEMGFFQDMGRGVKDALILLGLVGGFAVATRWIKAYIHWIALAFLFLASLSLLEVKQEQKPDTSHFIVNDFTSKSQVAQSVAYSKTRNIMVFVLDMATSEVVEDVIGHDAELKAKFPGFVAYRNNLGMHMSTDMGTAGLMTGMHFDNPSKLTDYTFSIFTEKSVLKDYLEKDIPMFVLPGSMHYGYTNRKQNKGEAVAEGQKHGSPFRQRIDGQMEWNLFEIVRFRACPFIFKQYMLKLTFQNWTNHGDITAESQLYPLLAQGALSEIPCAFHWYHTIGCHPPLDIDRNGHIQTSGRTDYPAYYEKIYHALRELSRLFDNYRQQGIYDRATIIVCADHGAGYRNGGAFIKGDISENAFPFLWVKAAHAAGDFELSTLSTSHSRIATLCRAARDKDLSRADIETILKVTDRFYRESLGSDLVDWHVDADGHVSKNIVKVERDLSQLKPFFRGRSYSLEAHNQDKPDLVSDTLDMASAYAPRLHANQTTTAIRFRVEGQGDCSIQLRLETMRVQTGHVPPSSSDPYIEITGEGAEPVEARFPRGEKTSVTIAGVTPDAQGVVEIRLTRKGLNDSFFIPRIEVR